MTPCLPVILPLFYWKLPVFGKQKQELVRMDELCWGKSAWREWAPFPFYAQKREACLVLN
jgi:hypothetical protein